VNRCHRWIERVGASNGGYATSLRRERARARRWPHQVCSSACTSPAEYIFLRIHSRPRYMVKSRGDPRSRSSRVYICTPSSGNATRLDARVRRARTRVKSRFLSRSLEFTAGQPGRRSMGGRMVNRAGRRPNFSGNFSFRVHRHVRNGRATTATKLDYADIENDDGRVRDRALAGLPEAAFFSKPWGS